MEVDCSRSFIVILQLREPQSQDSFIIRASLQAIILFGHPEAEIVTWETGKGSSQSWSKY